LKNSSIVFLIIFVIFIPLWTYLSLEDYIDSFLMLGIYPVVIIPLYLLMKRYEKNEKNIEELK